MDLSKLIPTIQDLQKRLKLMQDMKSQLESHVTIKITLESINIILHTLSIFLLVSTFKQGQRNSQHFYLINLSATELLKNIFYLVLSGINMHLEPYISRFSISRILAAKNMNALMVTMSEVRTLMSEVPINLADASSYIGLISCTAIYWVYIFAMILISVDRLMAAVCGVRYKTICTVSRSKVVVTSSWSTLFIIPATAMAGIYFTYDQEERLNWLSKGDMLLRVGLVFVPAVLNCLFLLFAFISYLIMFLAFVKTERNISSRNRSVFQMFRNSKFYVAILIITSFLFFKVIPSLVFFVITAFKTDISHVPLWLQICMRASDTTDVLIYTFLYTPVQKLWMQKIRSCCPETEMQNEKVQAASDGVHSKETECERVNLKMESNSEADV